MENKKTTELLDLLGKNRGDSYSAEVEDEIIGELRNRSPFFDLLNPDWESSLPTLFKRIGEMEEDIKKLKRHKHDDKTGDVMARI